MKKFRLLLGLFLNLQVSLYAQTYYINGTTDASLGNKALIHRNELKIGNSSSSTERAKNMIKIGDGSYIQIGELEADNLLSFKASKYNFTNGNVGIGTTNPQYKLDVNGTVRVQEIKVETEWADFVFNDDYHLKPLSEVNTFIKKNNHLPEIPSATEMKANEGVNVGEMQIAPKD
jgi:hypothetical protein